MDVVDNNNELFPSNLDWKEFMKNANQLTASKYALGIKPDPPGHKNVTPGHKKVTPGHKNVTPGRPRPLYQLQNYERVT